VVLVIAGGVGADRCGPPPMTFLMASMLHLITT